MVSLLMRCQVVKVWGEGSWSLSIPQKVVIIPMPIADLPYRIENLAKEGQYAYLTRPVRVMVTSSSRLRVLRNVDLCDGPKLWESTRTKSSPESYGFYVRLRLFATHSMVLEYLSGPEVASYCSALNVELPSIKEDEYVITEDNYMSPEAIAITRKEYSDMIQSRSKNLSVKSLEKLVCQIQGVDSLDSLIPPKRGRRRKIPPSSSPTSVAAAVPTAEITTTADPVVAPSSEDEDEEGKTTRDSNKETPPAPPGKQPAAPKKRKTRANLRDQFVSVQNTPSRVIDVSSYGDTMQHQRGRILDRVRHGDRISKCIVLSDLFPVISDNVASFERAMSSLGPRYSHRVTEFKAFMLQAGSGAAAR